MTYITDPDRIDEIAAAIEDHAKTMEIVAALKQKFQILKANSPAGELPTSAEFAAAYGEGKLIERELIAHIWETA